jgi:Flp pilus assembly protein TadD
VDNPPVRAGLSWHTVSWALTSTQQANWHPLTWLSHALDCELYGLNAGGHHVTNLILHLCNALLLFLLLLRAGGSAGRSFLAAALFALHPLNVESVAWVAERKNVLSTFFFLAALGAYGWYALKPDARRYALVALLFVLGLASKPMVITLPAVFLLVDVWPLNRIAGWGPPQEPAGEPGGRKRSLQRPAPKFVLIAPQLPWSRILLEKLPFFLLSAGSAVITVIAQRSNAIRSLEKFPLGVRLENAIYAYAMYLWKMFWPAGLALYYPHPGRRLAAWQVGLAAVFLITVSGLVWRQRRVRPYLVIGWLWYLGTLVPVIGIIQVGDQAMADRYAYIPLIGIFVMVVWGISDWADRRRINYGWRAVPAGVALLLLSLLTWRQDNYWQSSETVWAHTVDVTTNNAVAENSLGDAIHALGRPEEALPHFQRARGIYPTDPKILANLAEDLAECDRLPESISTYEAAVVVTADPEARARSYESLAILYGATGDYSKVRENYRDALQADPPQSQEIIRRMSKMVSSNPQSTGYLMLGILLQQAGQTADARNAYQEALKLDPALEDAKRGIDGLNQGTR